MSMDTYRVCPVEKPIPIRVRVPGSKSITNRALLTAALAEGESLLTGVLFSDDSRYFLSALGELGFSLEIDEEHCSVRLEGRGGAIPKANAQVNVGSAGTAARFLTAFLALSSGRYRMISSDQMKKRPMKELLTALEELGARFEFEEEPYHFPFTVFGRKYVGDGEPDTVIACISGGYGNGTQPGLVGYKHAFTEAGENGTEKKEPVCVSVNVDRSSQFLSALLMVSVLFEEGVEIRATGSHGMAYVEMTLRIMEQFGVQVNLRSCVPDKADGEAPQDHGNHGNGGEEPEDYALGKADGERIYVIEAGGAYKGRSYQVEPDLSAACYFYGAGMLLGVPAKVIGVHRDTMQGDYRFLEVMKDMGGRIIDEEDGICLLPMRLKPSAGQEKEERMEPPVSEEQRIRFHVPEECCDGWDLSSFSDQALTLAALAPFADKPVTLRGIGHIRFQECDRIRAITENLEAMGVACSQKDGSLTVFPPEDAGQLHGAVIHTFQDHRVAMAFAIPGLLLEGQIIEDPLCCRKTFENFFRVLESLHNLPDSYV